MHYTSINLTAEQNNQNTQNNLIDVIQNYESENNYTEDILLALNNNISRLTSSNNNTRDNVNDRHNVNDNNVNDNNVNDRHNVNDDIDMLPQSIPSPIPKKIKKRYPTSTIAAWGILFPAVYGQFDYRSVLPKKLVNSKGSPYGALYTSEVEGKGDVLIFLHEFSETLDDNSPGWETISLSQDSIIQTIGTPSKHHIEQMIEEFKPYFLTHPCGGAMLPLTLKPYYFWYEYKEKKRKKKVTKKSIRQQKRVLEKLYRKHHNQLVSALNEEYRVKCYTEIVKGNYIPQSTECLTRNGLAPFKLNGEHKQVLKHVTSR